MIIYDDSWHDRMANCAVITASDPTIETRLSFYINMFMEKPDSAGAPRANARGILVNVLGLLEEEADHHIENEVIIRNRRNNR